MEVLKKIFTKENVALGVAVITIGVAVITILYNIRAFHGQQEALQVNVFNSISERIAYKLDTVPSNKNENYVWYVTTLNALNNFAFYANHDYLRQEMIDFKKNFIIEECDAIAKESPEMCEKAEKEGGLEELKAFYEKHAGRKFSLIISQKH